MINIETTRRLVAELMVAGAYDHARQALPYDTTHGRRERAYMALYNEVVAAGRALGLGRDLDDIEGALGMPHDEVRQAFERECRRRLRGEVSSSVVSALEAARVALSDDLGDGLDDPDSVEIDRPRLLWEYVAGDRPSYRTGASRARSRS